jgi:hypothetical protein
VNEQEQRWIEESLLWLADQFGLQVLCESAVILPSEDYFPDPYSGTKGCVQAVLDRVCQYMRVDPEKLELHIYSEGMDSPGSSPLYIGTVHRYEGSAGVYGAPSSDLGKSIIGVESAQLADSPALVATLAHEVAHFLLRDKALPRSRMHRELLTDLVPVFFGLGILTSNVAFRFVQWRDHQYQGWRASRQGYLSEPMYGYALAAFAWMRQEQQVRWASYVAPNIRHYLKRSMRYLRRGGETALPAC